MKRLVNLGEALQRSIVLTGLRVEKMSVSPLRSRAFRTLEVSRGTFQHVSELVQTLQRTERFLDNTFKLSIRGLLGQTHIIETAGTEFLVARVSDVLEELRRLNVALDEEEKKNG